MEEGRKTLRDADVEGDQVERVELDGEYLRVTWTDGTVHRFRASMTVARTRRYDVRVEAVDLAPNAPLYHTGPRYQVVVRLGGIPARLERRHAEIKEACDEARRVAEELADISPACGCGREAETHLCTACAMSASLRLVAR